MKRIILASQSPQRRKLMKILGIPFEVRPARVEEVSRMTKGCAHLVKVNALLKAREVAGHYGDGLVIGTDTVVYLSKGRIVLKPKDLKE
ncbi:MAG: Maf family protein, partial [Candidatus Omnitrophica bacterium]|nr:Maf family protein [Candidatus Omnitrophota bacterium]